MSGVVAVKPDLLRRIAGTRAVDQGGRPLVVHHGTDAEFEGFGKSRDLGTHFGSRGQAEKRIADLVTERKIRRPGTRNRIVSALIRVVNPVVVPDDPIAWPASYMISLFRRFIPDAEMPRLVRLAEGADPARAAAAKAYIRDRIIAAGHDSILYRNVIESAHRARSVEWSWCVFDPANIVVLGENVPGVCVEVPDGMKSVFGASAIPVDPRTVPGGLRRRNGGFVYKADIVRFEKEVIGRLSQIDGFEGLTPPENKYAGHKLRFSLPDGSHLVAEVSSDLGRVMLIPGENRLCAAIKGLTICSDHGPPGENDYGLCFEWQPGEEIADTLRRVVSSITAWREHLAPVHEVRLGA